MGLKQLLLSRAKNLAIGSGEYILYCKSLNYLSENILDNPYIITASVVIGMYLGVGLTCDGLSRIIFNKSLIEKNRENLELEVFKN